MPAAVFSKIAPRIAQGPNAPRAPKYKRVADVVAAAIEDGELGPGDRLPPETTMASLFAVSLGTAQRALGVLVDRGLVNRTRRRGTFVAGQKATEVYVFRFKDPVTDRIVTPFTRVLSVSEAAPGGKWQRFLDAERCVRIERLLWVEGDPPTYSEVFIPFEFGGHLMNEPVESLHGASFHRVLAEGFNLPTLRTRHNVTCKVLADEACKHLMVPEGTFGSVWDVVGYSFKRATTFQSLQLPAGHRPIEWELAENAMAEASA